MAPLFVSPGRPSRARSRRRMIVCSGIETTRMTKTAAKTASLVPEPGPEDDDEAPPRRTRFWIFLVGVGVALSAVGGRAAWRGHETRTWPRVEAEIVDSRVTVRVDPSSRNTPAIGLTSSGIRDEFASYAANFVYTVDGVRHLGHGIERGDLGLQNSAKSRELGLAHPVGSKAMVAVDPNDPNVAYLVPGMASAAKLVTGVGLALIVAGLWVRGVSVPGPDARPRRRRRR